VTAARAVAAPTMVESWRPAFRGHQRLRIVGYGGELFDIEAELDGPIAVGFTRWAEANQFLNGLLILYAAAFS
jgi:hypothetical protein